MADCVALPNVTRLVGMLHTISACVEHGDACVLCKGESKPMCRCEKETALQVADAIEQLLAENAKLKAERDASASVLPCLCCDCDYHDHDGGAGYCNYWHRWSNMSDCCNHGKRKGGDEFIGKRWEWRGVKEEEDDKRDHAMRKVRRADAGGIQRQED